MDDQEAAGTAAAHAAEGRGFHTTLRVRWSDCDPAGIVFYPNYYAYFESAMMEFLQSRGASWMSLMRSQGVHFPRVESHCTYMAPASYEDTVRVDLRLREAARKVLTIGFTIGREPGRERICEGHVKFAMARIPTDGERARALELPDEIRQLFDVLAGVDD